VRGHVCAKGPAWEAEKKHKAEHGCAHPPSQYREFRELERSSLGLFWYNREMNRTSLYFVSIVILISLTSVFIFLVGDPEKSSISSDDQVLTVTGLIRESQNIEIQTLGSFLYRVEPSGGVLTEPLQLTFDLTGAQDRDFDVAIYWYDEEVLMWEIVSAPVDQAQESISIQRYELGLFSVREYVDINAPDFISTYDELLQMAPSDTVGYRIGVGFLSDDGSAVKVPGTTQTGGCGGVVLNGNTIEKSQLKDSARIFVNDVETEVDFIFVGLWFVNGNGGCVDELILEPTGM